MRERKKASSATAIWHAIGFVFASAPAAQLLRLRVGAAALAKPGNIRRRRVQSFQADSAPRGASLRAVRCGVTRTAHAHRARAVSTNLGEAEERAGRKAKGLAGTARQAAADNERDATPRLHLVVDDGRLERELGDDLGKNQKSERGGARIILIKCAIRFRTVHTFSQDNAKVSKSRATSEPYAKFL